MPLFDHLGELRRRLVIIFVSIFTTAVILYWATPELIAFLNEPIKDYVGELYVLNPIGGFSIRFRVAIYAAVIVTFPITFWQILAFFLPALKPKERKWVLPTLAAGTLLFILGTVFCYTIILEPAFEWMTEQTDAIGSVLADAERYIKIVLLFELAFGIAFQLPLLVFYLTVFNIVPYATLRKSWRTVYISLMILSAMVTPDANPVTMVFMFAALIALYEISLLLARIVLARRIKKQKEDGELPEDDGDADGDEALAQA